MKHLQYAAFVVATLILTFAPAAQAQRGYTPSWIDETGNYKEIVLAVQYGECPPVTTLEAGITCRTDTWRTPTAIWRIPGSITRRIATTQSSVQLGTAYVGFRRELGYYDSDPSQTYATMYFNAQVTRGGRSRWLSEVINVPGEPLHCSSLYSPLDQIRQHWESDGSYSCETSCDVLAQRVSPRNLGDYAAVFLNGVRYQSSIPYFPDPDHGVIGYGGSRPTTSIYYIGGRQFVFYTCDLRLGMTNDAPTSRYELLYQQAGYLSTFPQWTFTTDLYQWMDRPRGPTVADLCPSVDPYGSTDVLPHPEIGCAR